MEEQRQFTEYIIVRDLRPLRLFRLQMNNEGGDSYRYTTLPVLIGPFRNEKKEAQKQIPILLISSKK